ncbi:hypothetical protein TGGT1_235420 [Toxoplasma gondii GT1]|uniref:Uncharacterized protein n=2 Tax=Toxoplasma gondii TaxID=5811 RepID=S7W632_TOXGG|nr:hypothetical protein TGGT1_235420 [Toxoplasma gondii GT1]KAF4640278.1 hypothetical protein TGRH88_042030 [Toxoplasma gondii]
MTVGGGAVKGSVTFRTLGDTPQMVSPLGLPPGAGMARECGDFPETVPAGCLLPGDTSPLMSLGAACGRGDAAPRRDPELAEGAFASGYEVSPGYSFLGGLQPSCLLPLASVPASPAAVPSLVSLNVRPHRAFLRQEENWLARDFYQERRWKMAAAGRVGGLVAARARWLELRKKREERRFLAAPIASAVQAVWLGAVSQVEPGLIPPALQPCCASLPPTASATNLRLSLLRRRCRPAFLASGERTTPGGDGDTACSVSGVSSPRAGATADLEAKAALLRAQVRNQAAALLSPQVRGKLGSLFFLSDNPLSVCPAEDRCLFVGSGALGQRGPQPWGADGGLDRGSGEKKREKKEERRQVKSEEDKSREEAKQEKRKKGAEGDAGEGSTTGEGVGEDGAAELPNRGQRIQADEGGEKVKEDENQTEDCAAIPRPQDKSDEEDNGCMSPRKSALESGLREDASPRPSARAHRRKSATDEATLDASLEDGFLPLSPSLHAFLLDTVARGIEEQRQSPFVRLRREAPLRRGPGDSEGRDGLLPSFAPLLSGSSSILLPCARDARGDGPRDKKKEEKREEDTPLSSRDLGLTAGVSEASPSAGSITSASREVDSPVHSVSTTWSSSLPLPGSSPGGLDGVSAPAAGASPVGKDTAGRGTEKNEAEGAGRAGGAASWGVPGACTCCFCRGEKTEGERDKGAGVPFGADPDVSSHPTAGASSPPGLLSVDGEAEKPRHCTCQLCYLSEGVWSKREYLASAALLGADEELRHAPSLLLHSLPSPSFGASGLRGPGLFGESDDGACLSSFDADSSLDVSASDPVSLSDWIYLQHEKTLDLAAPLTFDILANAPPSVFLGAAFSGFSDRAGPAGLSRRTREDRGGSSASSRLKASRSSGRLGTHALPLSPAHRDVSLECHEDPLADARDQKGEEVLKGDNDETLGAPGQVGAGGRRGVAWGPLSSGASGSSGDASDGREDRTASGPAVGAARERDDEGDEDDDDLRPGSADGVSQAPNVGAEPLQGVAEGASAASVALRHKSRLARKERRRRTAWKLLENVSLSAIWDILSRKTDNAFTDLLPVEFRPPDWRLDVCQIPALKHHEEWEEAIAELSDLAADPFSPACGASPFPFVPDFLLSTAAQGLPGPAGRGLLAFPEYLGPVFQAASPFASEGLSIGAPGSRPRTTEAGVTGADKENRDGQKDDQDERLKDGREEDASHLSPSAPGLYHPGGPGADRGRVDDPSRPGETGAEHGLASYPYLHAGQASSAAYARHQARGCKGSDPSLSERLFAAEAGQRPPLFSSPYLPKTTFPAGYPPGAFPGYAPVGPGRAPLGGPAPGAQAPGATAVSRGRHLMPPGPGGMHAKGPQGAGASLSRARDEFGAQRGAGVCTGGLSGGTLGASGARAGARSHPQWDLNESAMLLALVKKFGQPNPHYIPFGSHRSRLVASLHRSAEAKKRRLRVVAGLRHLLQRRRLGEKAVEEESGAQNSTVVARKRTLKHSLASWSKKGRLLSLLAAVEREEVELERASTAAEKDGEAGRTDAGARSEDWQTGAKKGTDSQSEKLPIPSVLTYSSRSVNWDLVATTLSNSGTWLANALAGSDGGRKPSFFSPQGVSLVSLGDAMASSAVSRLRSPAECREQYLLLRAHLRKMVTQPRTQRHPMLVLLLQQYYKHIRRHPTFQENFYPFRPRHPLPGGRAVSSFSPGPPLFSQSVRESLATGAFAPLVDKPPSRFFHALLPPQVCRHLENAVNQSVRAGDCARKETNGDTPETEGDNHRLSGKILHTELDRECARRVVVFELRDGAECDGEAGSSWTETGKRKREWRGAFALKHRRLEGESAKDRMSVVFSEYPIGNSFAHDLALWCSRLLGDSYHRASSSSRKIQRLSPLHQFLEGVQRHREERSGGSAYPRNGVFGSSRFLVQALSSLLSRPSRASLGVKEKCGDAPQEALALGLSKETKPHGSYDHALPLPRRLQLLIALAAELGTHAVLYTPRGVSKSVSGDSRKNISSLVDSVLGSRSAAAGARTGKAPPGESPVAIARVGTVWGGDVPGAETVWETLEGTDPVAYGLALHDVSNEETSRHFGSFALRCLPLPSPAISANRTFFSSAFDASAPSGPVKKPRPGAVSCVSAVEASAPVPQTGSETPREATTLSARAAEGERPEGEPTAAERECEKMSASQKDEEVPRQSREGQGAPVPNTKQRAEQEPARDADEKGKSVAGVHASAAEKAGFWLMLDEVGTDAKGSAGAKPLPPLWRTARSSGGLLGFGLEGPTFHEMIRCVTRKSLGALACSASHLCQPGRFGGRASSPSRTFSCGARRSRGAGAEGIGDRDRARVSLSAGSAGTSGSSRLERREEKARHGSLRDAWVPAEISQQESEGIKFAASLVCRCSDSMRKRLAALNSLSDALGVRSLLPPGVPGNPLLVPPHPSQLRFLDGANHLLSSYVHRQEGPSLLYSFSAPRSSPEAEATTTRATKLPDPLSASNRLSLGVLPLTGPLNPQQFGATLAPWLLIVNLALQRGEQEQLLASATQWIQQASRSSLGALPPSLSLAAAGPAILTPAVASLDAFRKPQLPEVLAVFRSQQGGHRLSTAHSRNSTEGASSRQPTSSLSSQFAMARTGAGSLPVSTGGSSIAYSSSFVSSSLHASQAPPRVVLTAPAGASPQGPVPFAGGVAAAPSPGAGPAPEAKGGARLSTGREGDGAAPAYSRPFPKDRQGGPTGPEGGVPASPYFFLQGCPSSSSPAYAPSVSYQGHVGGVPGSQAYPAPMPVPFQKPHETSSEDKAAGNGPRARMLVPSAGASGATPPQHGGMLPVGPGARSGPAARPETQDPSFHSSGAATGPYQAFASSPGGPSPGAFASAPPFHGAVPPGSAGGDSTVHAQGQRRDVPSFPASGGEDRQGPFGAHGPAGSTASGPCLRPEEGAPGSGKSVNEPVSSGGATHAKSGHEGLPPSFGSDGEPGPHPGSGVFVTQRVDSATAGSGDPSEVKGGEQAPEGTTRSSGSEAAAGSSPPFRTEEGAKSHFASAPGHPAKHNSFAPPSASGTPLHGPADPHAGAVGGVPPSGPGVYPQRGAPGSGRGPFPPTGPLAHPFSSMPGPYLQPPQAGSVAVGPYGQAVGPQLAGGARSQPGGAGETPSFPFQAPRPGDTSGMRDREAEASPSGVAPSAMHSCAPGQRPGTPAEGRVSGGKETDSAVGLAKAKNLSAPGFYYPGSMGPEPGAPEENRAGRGEETGSQGPPGERGGARAEESHANYSGPGGEPGYDAAQSAGSGYRMAPGSASPEYNSSFGPSYFSSASHGSKVPQNSPGVPGDGPLSGAPAPHAGQGGPGAGPTDPYPGGPASDATHAGPAGYFGAPGSQPGGVRSEELRRRSAGPPGVPGAPLVAPDGGGYGYPVAGKPTIGKEDVGQQPPTYLPYPGVGNATNIPRSPGDDASLNRRREGQESPCPGWGGGALPGGPYASSVSSLSSSPPSSTGSKPKRTPSTAGAKAHPPRKRQKKQQPPAEKANPDSPAQVVGAPTPPFSAASGLKPIGEEERHSREGVGPDRAPVTVGGSPPKKEDADGGLNHHGRGVQPPSMSPSVHPASASLPQGFENAGSSSIMGMGATGPFASNQMMPGVRPSDASGPPGGFLVQHPSPFLPHVHAAPMTPHEPNAPPQIQMLGTPGAPSGGRDMPTGQESVPPNLQAPFTPQSNFPGGLPSVYGPMATPGQRPESLQSPQPHRGPLPVSSIPGQAPHMGHPTQPARGGMHAPFSAMGKVGPPGTFAGAPGAKPAGLGESGGPVSRSGDFGDASRGAASGAQHSHPVQQMPPHTSFVSGVPGPSGLGMSGAPASGVSMPAEGSHALSHPGGMHALGASQAGPGFLPYSQNAALPADTASQKSMNPQLQGSFPTSASLPPSFPSQMHSVSQQPPFVNAGAVPVPQTGAASRGPAFFNGGDRGSMQPPMHAVPSGYFHGHQNPYDPGHRGNAGPGAPSGPVNSMSAFSSLPMHPYGASMPGTSGEGHAYASPPVQSPHLMNRESTPAGGPGSLGQASPSPGGLTGAPGGACGVSNVAPFAQAGAYIHREGLDRQNRGAPSQQQFQFPTHPGQRSGREGRDGEAAYSAMPQTSYYPPPAPGQFQEEGA